MSELINIKYIYEDFLQNKRNEDLYIFTHTQFGDLYIQFPIFYYLSDFFNKIIIPVRKLHLNSIDITQNTNIQFIEYINDCPCKKLDYMSSFKYFINKSEIKYYIEMGHNRNDIDENPIDFFGFNIFYKVINLPNEIYFNFKPYFFKSNIEIPKNKYIFISIAGSDSSRNIDIPQNIKKKYLCICPDYNLYDKDHLFYSLAEKYINCKTSDYISLIENSFSLIVVDAGYYWLSKLCDCTKIENLICIRRDYFGKKMLYENPIRNNSNKYIYIDEHLIKSFFNIYFKNI